MSQTATPARGIQLQTAVPGPRSQALMARRQAAVPRGVGSATPIAMARGEGAMVEDVDGNWYVDLAGGIGVMNVGYGNPAVLEAAQHQAALFTHSCFQVLSHEPYVEVCEALNRLTPGSHAKKTLLLNSGAEAVENAVKIARAATGRHAVIAFEHGFHGRTLLGMTLTSKVAYKQGFGPFAPEVYRAPYPRTKEDVSALVTMFKTHVDPQSVACMIIEPVLGEGGFTPAPEGFFEALTQLCKDHGILLVADEIQTGIGRTGKAFACEHFNLVPDLITSAKSLAGGFPLAAVTGRAEIMDAAAPGGLGSTFGGNAVACAAALATLGQLDELNARADEIGRKVRARFNALNSPVVQEVRGLGAMIGVVFARDGVPATAEMAALHKYAYEHGVITVTAGTHANVLRTLMPLVITDAQLDQALDVLVAGINAVFK
ncbi:MAG: 4-aminobutyrate aminotransferase [Cyanobacteria bacterium RYN_339]|nr:4-aminobutyrate aminotransferase [Cyanobacteria bacterium RYN_339]